MKKDKFVKGNTDFDNEQLQTLHTGALMSSPGERVGILIRVASQLADEHGGACSYFCLLNGVMSLLNVAGK